ncbi:hypothetical protein [Streptomyces sp. NBC_00525]|uniref:hypothetical protein n=1 Tax=Streptomyces sp. NBC_00525 TaxID=2903660 RepID=UPI002E8124D2|nr:hypothetical protein [Streptomyces sp. NBC_00525]WUC97420.1 hypothetical protein OG710_29070 [Streptomyces sp. NBC_00525]
MASDTSLVFNLVAKDRASGEISRLEQRFGALGKVISGLGPLTLPILAGVAAGVATVGSTLLGAGVAVGVFGAAIAPQVASIK